MRSATITPSPSMKPAPFSPPQSTTDSASVSTPSSFVPAPAQRWQPNWAPRPPIISKPRPKKRFSSCAMPACSRFFCRDPSSHWAVPSIRPRARWSSSASPLCWPRTSIPAPRLCHPCHSCSRLPASRWAFPLRRRFRLPPSMPPGASISERPSALSIPGKKPTSSFMNSEIIASSPTSSPHLHGHACSSRAGK